jgi:hypothetical protein
LAQDRLASQLEFLVYLNDGFTGGDIDFRWFRVKPEAGGALLFVRDTWHEGAAVECGIKYVLRLDVLYGRNFAGSYCANLSNCWRPYLIRWN